MLKNTISVPDKVTKTNINMDTTDKPVTLDPAKLNKITLNDNYFCNVTYLNQENKHQELYIQVYEKAFFLLLVSNTQSISIDSDFFL